MDFKKYSVAVDFTINLPSEVRSTAVLDLSLFLILTDITQICFHVLHFTAI